MVVHEFNDTSGCGRYYGVCDLQPYFKQVRRPDAAGVYFAGDVFRIGRGDTDCI